MKSFVIVMRMVAQVVLPLAILGTGIGIFIVLSMSRAKPETQEHKPQISLVETAVVESFGDGPLILEVDGVVVPHREIQLAAEVTGRIVSKEETCRVGNFVDKGTTLFQIDSEEALLERDRLREEKQQAELSLAELDTEKANLKKILDLQNRDLTLQSNDMARVERLIRTGAGTSSALDRATKNMIVAENSILTTKNQISLLESKAKTLASATKLVDQRLRRTQLDIDGATVRAPFSGMIVEEHVEEDSYIQRGSVLVTIEDTRQADVRCNLRMDELYWIWTQDAKLPAGVQREAMYDLPDTPVLVKYRLNGRNFQWDGVLSRYDGLGLDEKTRTVPCRVDVLHPTKVKVDGLLENSVMSESATPALVRGMFVQIQILAHPQVALLRVPEIAIRPNAAATGQPEYKEALYKTEALEEGPDGVRSRLRRIPVQTALIRDGMAILYDIQGDLVAGDHVVISPLSTETDGATVMERVEE